MHFLHSVGRIGDTCKIEDNSEKGKINMPSLKFLKDHFLEDLL